MSEPFRVVPASYLILSRGSEVLLQLRRNTGFRDGFWATAAAGHVEAGESAPEAAVREAREELAIDVEVQDLEPICAMHRKQGQNSLYSERVDFFFRTTRWQGDPARGEVDRIAELRWFELWDLPDKMVSHEWRVYESLRSGDLAPLLTFGFDE